jgi:hypothetical protein
VDPGVPLAFLSGAGQGLVMDLATLVDELDLEYRVAAVRGDDWADIFAEVYPDPYWREYAEPGYEGRWNGLMVRGANEVAGAATCVFPSDAVIAAVDQGTFLFSEHPVDFADEPVSTARAGVPPPHARAWHLAVQRARAA